MNFNGLNVFHGKFGCGKIVDVRNEVYLDVKMENGEIKKFVYPDSFMRGLKFEEEKLNEEVDRIYNERELKKEEERKKRMENVVCLDLKEKIDYSNEINLFRDEFDFLSNMYDCKVIYNGIEFKNSESAFQAQKSLDEEVRKSFSELSGKKSKYRGKRIELREDWEKVKVKIMYEVVKSKFENNIELKNKLIGTGNRILIEGNSWNDRFWGVCRGKGHNYLGRILMKVREELR